MGWSLGLAIWSTLGIAFLMTGVLEEVVAEELAATLVGSILLVSPLIGLALGISSFERGMKSPPLVWVSTIWNGVLLGLWLLLIIVGLTMS
jgi:hypothetical protein